MEKKTGSITISVALAVYNEADNLEACLSSVSSLADELVIVDGGSTDETVAIAKQHNATVIRTGNPPMFHINKQKALDACSGRWILQLDADEVVPPELAKEIRRVTVEGKGPNAYYIPRKNYFLGHWLSKGGQYPDYVIRLLKNGKGYFPCKSVHEQIAVEGAVGHLTSALKHYTSRTFADYWRKADAYTTLTAKEFAADHLPVTVWSYLRYTVLLPLGTFLRLYVRHKGFVDGVWGFLFAVFSGLHHATAYRKYAANV